MSMLSRRHLPEDSGSPRSSSPGRSSRGTHAGAAAAASAQEALSFPQTGLQPAPATNAGILEELARRGIQVSASCSQTFTKYAATYFPGVGCPREGLLIEHGSIRLMVEVPGPRGPLFWKQERKPLRVEIYTPEQNPKMPQSSYEMVVQSPNSTSRFGFRSMERAADFAQKTIIFFDLFRRAKHSEHKVSVGGTQFPDFTESGLPKPQAERGTYFSTVAANALAKIRKGFRTKETRTSRTISDGAGSPDLKEISLQFEISPQRTELAALFQRRTTQPPIGAITLSFEINGPSDRSLYPAKLSISAAGENLAFQVTNEDELKVLLDAATGGMRAAMDYR